MARRRDRRYELKNSKEARTRGRTRVLGRKREIEKRDSTRGHGAHPRGWVARPGAGPRHLAFWLGGGPPGQPQVPSGGLLPKNFEYNFFCNFLGNFTVENFSKFKKLQKNFHELEIKVRACEVLVKETLVQQGE